jgi:sulfate adenylyltransferase subunit 1
MELLKFITAGNVDDGKSTLIGRLLHDSRAILDDQMEALRVASAKRGERDLDLALLTDGLRAEREQGITIDVAYRYFTTPKRKFIIADCPGHVQYTRNMVTGASGVNLAVLLVDVRKGLQEQTRRHCFVASLLRIPHLVICVNKMDLVGFAQAEFEKVRAEFEQFSRKLEIHDVSFIPISALEGDNVVTASDRTPWYTGRCLLEHLEEVHVSSDLNYIDSRFAIQTVIRPQSEALHDYRGYAGMMLSGGLRVGDEVVALPSGFPARISAIERGGVAVDEALAMESVIIRLDRDIDLGRGGMITRANNQPDPIQDIEAFICWMDPLAYNSGRRYLARHTTAEAKAVIKEILYKIDIQTLSRTTETKKLQLNDFARARLRVSQPFFSDPYRVNRMTGSFILIDEETSATVGAGLIL